MDKTIYLLLKGELSAIIPANPKDFGMAIPIENYNNESLEEIMKAVANMMINLSKNQ